MTRAPSETPKRRKRGFEAAATLLAGDLKGPAEKRGFADAKLLTHWAEIVGQDIAGIARPVEITHGRGFGGTLVVLTTGGNAPVLEMQKDRLVEKVNACYGYRAVSRVHITQTAPVGFSDGKVAFQEQPAQPRQPDRAKLDRAMTEIEEIEDEGLRDALARLARNVTTPRNS